MLDPVKNARALGVLIAVVTLLQGVVTLVFLGATGFNLVTIVSLVSVVVTLVVAYGLIKRKLWGVYGLGISGLLALAVVIWEVLSGEKLDVMSLAGVIITFILFAWFYSGRSGFSK